MQIHELYPLRLWVIVNPPSPAIHVPVVSIDEALNLGSRMALAELENPDITDNVFGVEVWDGGEWIEFEGEDGVTFDDLMREL